MNEKEFRTGKCAHGVAVGIICEECTRAKLLPLARTGLAEDGQPGDFTCRECFRGKAATYLGLCPGCAAPAPAYPIPTTSPAPAYPIPGTHVDPNTVNGDVSTLGVMIVRLQAEVAAIGAEALRIQDDARKQLDALKRLAKYDGKETDLRNKAANYDEISAMIKTELVEKRGWAPINALDAFEKLFNDNVRLTAELDLAKRNLATTVDELREVLESPEGSALTRMNGVLLERAAEIRRLNDHIVAVERDRNARELEVANLRAIVTNLQDDLRAARLKS